MSKRQGETSVWKLARLLLSPRGFRLFRNQRYKGQIVRNGQVTDARADCGLCDGASDLIGWRIITVTADMVGKRFAQFVAIETKVKGKKASPDQATFLAAVNRDGGMGVVLDSEEAITAFRDSQENHAQKD